MKLMPTGHVRGHFAQRLTLAAALLVFAILPACGGGSGSGGAATVDPNTGYDRGALRLLTTQIDFGSLFIGEGRDEEIRILNLSAESTLTITGCDLPAADYEIVGDTFPLAILPGEVVGIDVRCTPTREGILDGEFILRPAAPYDSMAIRVTAVGRIKAEERITDFGTLALDGSGRTPILTVEVPADAISLSMEGVAGVSDVVGLDTLTGPGGKVYENAQSTGPYQWGFKVFSWGGMDPPHAFLATVPNSDRAGVQLVPGGGTYTFSLRRRSGTSLSMRVRAFVERRAPEVPIGGLLDLNIFLADGIWPTAASASSDAPLQSILSNAERILEAQGIRLGDISYYDLKDQKWDLVHMSDYRKLLRLSSAASMERVNLFYVKGFDSPALGLSGTVSGPKRNGTSVSGVVCLYSPNDVSQTGLVTAHEIGHYLGLWHTWEQDGSVDLLDDTSAGWMSGNLMDRRLGGSTLTAGQGLVMRSHPHIRPDL